MSRDPSSMEPSSQNTEETLPRSGVDPQRKTTPEVVPTEKIRPGGTREGSLLKEGGKVGKYPIIRKIGQGGMGQVWLGHHPELDIPVAIKVLPSFLIARDPSFIDRFIKEARTAARLNHTHIVRIYDAGKDDDIYYLVMEYVEGGTVQDLLKQHGGKLPLPKALEIIRAIAEALDVANHYNIIHRDIKPENILLDRQGIPKLSDLGLAKQLGGEESMTGTGMAVGTPSYMAPEQIQDAKNCDHRTDIYSLGATFYHLITGSVPFEGKSAFDQMLKHIQEPLPPPSQRDPAIPSFIEAIIMKMMAKNPNDRYQNARELIVDLDRAKHKLSLLLERPQKRLARRVKGLLLVGSVCILLGITAWLLKSFYLDKISVLPSQTILNNTSNVQSTFSNSNPISHQGVTSHSIPPSTSSSLNENPSVFSTLTPNTPSEPQKEETPSLKQGDPSETQKQTPTESLVEETVPTVPTLRASSRPSSFLPILGPPELIRPQP